MAQKVNIVLVDDIDGSDASETVSFGLDGTSYEIDLNDKNAAALRDALSAYVGHARKVSTRGRRGRTARPRPPPARAPASCATGPAPTASRSPTAAGCPPRCARRSTPPTELAGPRRPAGLFALGVQP